MDRLLRCQLANTEEMQNGESKGSLGEVFIRYVQPVQSFGPIPFASC